MSTTSLAHQLETHIRQELPSLSVEWADELADIIQQLVGLFQPERIHVFGSRAQGDSNDDSDIDLMVVISETDEPGYRLAQHARLALRRRYLFSMDLLIWSSSDFDRATPNPATLPATILREGKVLYAA